MSSFDTAAGGAVNTPPSDANPPAAPGPSYAVHNALSVPRANQSYVPGCLLTTTGLASIVPGVCGARLTGVSELSELGTSNAGNWVVASQPDGLCAGSSEDHFHTLPSVPSA